MKTLIFRTLAIPAALICLAGASIADDILVQAGGSIQTAINNSKDGDRILVQPGTYFETIDYSGKSIEVIGSGGAAATILDGQGTAPVVRFSGGEDASTQLVGLTVTGGAAAFGAGGIAVAFGVVPTISDCIVRDNSGRLGAGISGSPILIRCAIYQNSSSLNHGGGIAGAPQMRECVVANNSCSGADGAGLYIVGLAGTSILIEDCMIVENRAVLTGSSGGGAYVDSSINATFRRCVIANNSATGGVFAGIGGGIRFEAAGTVEECVVYGNTLSGSSLLGGGIYGPASVTNSIIWANSSPALDSTASVTYSDVQSGASGLGNFNSDPLFVNQFLGDLHLGAGSPCIDAGDPSRTDADGSRLDLGPYSFATLYARDNTATNSWFDAAWSTISATTGGRQVLKAQLGSTHAGETFAVLGSITGSSPGFTVFGTLIPLTPDDYTLATLIAPASTPLIGAFGILGSSGEAEIEVVLPPSSLDLVGITAWHAVVHGSFVSPIQIGATNATSVTIE